MKKLILIGLFVASILTSCEKDDVALPRLQPKEVIKTAYFSGYASPTAILTHHKITGQKVTCGFNIKIELRKGDRLTFVDNGNDIYHPAFTMYNPDGTIFYQRPEEIEHGYTYGVIMVDAVIVRESNKNLPDVNISYTYN